MLDEIHLRSRVSDDRVRFGDEASKGLGLPDIARVEIEVVEAWGELDLNGRQVKDELCTEADAVRILVVDGELGFFF